MATAGSNNTDKGMLMHEAVDTMMAANVKRQQQLLINCYRLFLPIALCVSVRLFVSALALA